jgi:hypothetical protein
MFKKIFLALFIFAFFPILFLSIIYILYISHSINRELTTGLEISLEVIDAFDSQIIDERISDMLSLNTMSIPEVCFEYNRPEAMRIFLKKIQKTNKNYSALVAYKPNGDFFSIWGTDIKNEYKKNCPIK